MVKPYSLFSVRGHFKITRVYVYLLTDVILMQETTGIKLHSLKHWKYNDSDLVGSNTGESKNSLIVFLFGFYIFIQSQCV